MPYTPPTFGPPNPWAAQTPTPQPYTPPTFGGATPATPSTTQPGFWGSNTGAAAIGGATAAGSAIAQGLANRAQNRETQEFTAQQNQQRMLADLFGAQMAAQQDQNQLDQQRQQTGLQATQLDPLTQQRSRANFAMTRALMGNARNVEVQAPPGMSGFQPRITGGMRIPEGGFGPDVMNYLSEDAQLAADANFGQNAAPFMRPPNYAAVGYGSLAAPSAASSAPQPGTSEAVESVFGAGAGGLGNPMDPVGGGGTGGAPPIGGTGTSSAGSGPVSGDINNILGGFGRRGGGTPGAPTSAAGGFISGGAQGASIGGMIGGPIGAGIGAAIGSTVQGIWGAINHRADSAPPDLAIGDARQAITMAYQQFLGRDPSAEELNGIVQGQGWQPGDRWMGASSINYVLNQIGQSDEAQARRQQASQPAAGVGGGGGSAAPNPQTSGRNYMSRTAGDEAQTAHDLYIQYLRQQQNQRTNLQQQFEQQRQLLQSTYGGGSGSTGSTSSQGSGGSTAGRVASQARSEEHT